MVDGGADVGVAHEQRVKFLRRASHEKCTRRGVVGGVSMSIESGEIAETSTISDSRTAH